VWPEEGERRVLEGSSLLVTGIAGTGKTHFLQGVVERLRTRGKIVDIISKTHVASRRAGGVTTDH
jgi:predicted PilT family ATPase